jgi:hypothetical protein
MKMSRSRTVHKKPASTLAGRATGWVLWPTCAGIAVWKALGHVPPGIETAFFIILWCLVSLGFIVAGTLLWGYRRFPAELSRAERLKTRLSAFVAVRMVSSLVIWVALSLSGRPVLGGLCALSVFGVEAVRYVLHRRTARAEPGG